ncbi:MAG: hypothetical protein R8K54_05190 [Mariprofundaceae bacterium]
MSKDRDINDILDSLNQLLHEGESHNDDHVETDEAVNEEAEEIEAELHELEEDDAVSEDMESEGVKPEPLEDHFDSSREASDAGNEGPQEAPISVQRVVLTEDMLVNNPQGNLLSTGMGDKKEITEPVTELESIETQTVNIDHLPMAQLEPLLERISDDVISQLQQQLPALIKTALDCHLAKLRDEKQSENHSEE